VNVYDGFSFHVWLWLEALGICRLGEAFEFTKGGRTTITGELPVNTGGGHLGEGALAGSPQISESILQVMGRAGVRQVDNVHYALAGTDRPTRGQVLIFSSEDQ
jgi:acetyl-CoA acetyltransferase